jgi:SulP family sulfate permease
MYLKNDLKADLIAGIVVGLVALPLSIAFAIASGVSAEQGLYTAIIAGGIIAVFSGSKYQVSGPTGAFIVILLSIVNKFGVEGLLMTGLILLIRSK